MKQFLSLLAAVCLFSLLPSDGVARAMEDAPTPAQKAQKIAQSSAWVQKQLAALHAEANKIHDATLRKETLAILDGPAFKLAERHGEAAQIRTELLAKQLLNTSDEPAELIPARAAMPFVAAPGSPWTVHHTYPGGLVIHTATNLQHALSLGHDLEGINAIRLNEDFLRAAPIWHDCAKTWSIEWLADGTATKNEGSIAGTATHHVLGVAEALLRGLPPSFIVILASAHQPPDPGAGNGLSDVINWLKAASIISGKPYSAAGLIDDGSALAQPAPLEAYIHHLSDHDYVISMVSMRGAVDALAVVQTSTQEDAWQRDQILARTGDLKIYSTWLEAGVAGVKSLLAK